MKPYRIKHIPTGLYYQPVSASGNNLSKKGKIYQSAANVLATSTYNKEGESRICLEVRTNSIVYKQTKDLLNWEAYNAKPWCKIVFVPVSDFEKEEI